MKVSSSLTSYIYDKQKDAAQKRQPEDVNAYERQNRLIEGDPSAAENSHPPVEQVVEGEWLGDFYDTSYEDVLKNNHAHFQQEDDVSYNEQNQSFRVGQAIEQYQNYAQTDDRENDAVRGRQIDFYV